MDSGIWLGDAIRALARIRPESNEQREAVVGALGFELGRPGTVSPEPRLPSVQPPKPPTGPDLNTPATADHQAAAAPDQDVPQLEPVGQQTVSTSSWSVKSLPRPTREMLGRARPHRPLLAPRTGQAILQAALSRQIEGGDIDVDALIDTVASGSPVDNLPRRATRTMRFGVDILADRGVGMAPFGRDVNDLIESVRRVVGQERTRVTYFADAPLRGAGGRLRRRWKPYRPPDPGARVLVLSDFGIGGPMMNPSRAQPAEWAAFSACVRQYGCDVIGLVPYPSHRWTPAVRSLFPLLCWDRSTTAAAAFALRS